MLCHFQIENIMQQEHSIFSLGLSKYCFPSFADWITVFILTPHGSVCLVHLMAHSLLTGQEMAYLRNVELLLEM